MPAGLQAWDENQVMIVDLTTRLGRIVGVRNVSATESGTISVPAGYGQMWVYPIQNDNMGYTPNLVQQNETTFSFAPNNNFPTGARPATILYGVR